MVLLMPVRDRVSSDAPSYAAGNSIEPTPTIRPWPFIRRGTEWLVPIVPGLVRLTVVPWKSAISSLPPRALRMSSSYAVQKAAKFIFSAPLIEGTSSCRVPSGLGRSIARPRLTWAG